MNTNYAANAVGRYKFNQKVYTVGLVILLILPLVTVLGYYILGKPITELASSSSVWTAVINYVTMVVLATSTTLLNRRVVKDLQGCVDVIDTLQDELVACRSENSKLRKELAKSERKRKEAEAIARQYWEMLPEDLRKLAEDQCKFEDAIEEMLELNSSQDTSSGS